MQEVLHKAYNTIYLKAGSKGLDVNLALKGTSYPLIFTYLIVNNKLVLKGKEFGSGKTFPLSNQLYPA